MLISALRSRLERALAINGGLYKLDDILEEIKRNKMQSFACNQSWAVTQVEDYPQKRVLTIVLVVGEMEDVDDMYAQIKKYALENGAVRIQAWGRPGWVKKADQMGWHKTTELYVEDLI
jgi:hypothetical protein